MGDGGTHRWRAWALALLPILLIGLAALAILAPIAVSGRWPASHEGLNYLFRAAEFNEAFWNGQLYPRWQAHLYGGYGYPIFTFYQPFFFYTHLGVSLLTASPLPRMYATLWLLLTVGGSGAYLLSRRLGGSSWVGGFGASLFLLTPYLYVNLWVRGDLSELTALLLTPWPLYAYLRLAQGVAGRGTYRLVDALLLGGSLAALIMSHPATALFYVPVFTAITGLDALRPAGGNRRTLLVPLLAGIGLGLTLSAPYWFTVFQMEPHARFSAFARFTPEEHAVFWWQLVDPSWWQVGTTVPGSQDTMSFQLGPLHLLLALVGLILGRKRRLRLLCGLAYALLIGLMLPLSLPLWNAVELLQLVQFPWRILSVTAVLQLVLLVGLADGLKGLSSHKKKALVYGAIALLTAVVHHRQFIPQTPDADVSTVVGRYPTQRMTETRTLVMENEYLPRTASAHLRPATRLVSLHPGGRVEAAEESSRYHIRYRFTAPGPGQIRISQLYFPGWKVLVNGVSVSDEQLRSSISPEGLLQVPVAAGADQSLEAWYDGPPHRRLRTAIILLVAAALVLGLWRYRGAGPHRERPDSDPDPPC